MRRQARQLKPLTEHFPEEGWSRASWQVDAHVVDRYTGQRHSNPHQRVDGVTVEGNHNQEYAAKAVDKWEEQRELQGKQDLHKGKKVESEKRKRVAKGWGEKY